MRRRLAILAASALLLSGCELLFPDLGSDFEPPRALATYDRGLATLELEDGTTIVLDTVAKGSQLWSVMGADARWSNAEGWHLKLSGGTSELAFGATLGLDRIVDGQHWTTSYNMAACAIDVDQSDADGLRGTARCHGLRWVDALGAPMFMEAEAFIEGQEPFDATVTFEARPAAEAPTT